MFQQALLMSLNGKPDTFEQFVVSCFPCRLTGKCDPRDDRVWCRSGDDPQQGDLKRSGLEKRLKGGLLCRKW